VHSDETRIGITNGPAVASFKLTSGAANWSYQASAQTTLSIVASETGNVIVVKATDLSGNDSVIRFDSSGNATTDSCTSAVQYDSDGQWFGFSTLSPGPSSASTSQRRLSAQGIGLSSVAAFAAPPVFWASATWQMPRQGGTLAAEPVLKLLGKTDCYTAERDLEFGSLSRGVRWRLNLVLSLRNKRNIALRRQTACLPWTILVRKTSSPTIYALASGLPLYGARKPSYMG
jgi:hypothetical protein